MSYNLFLDDYRMPKDAFAYTFQKEYISVEWIVVRNYYAFIQLIRNKGIPEIVSFDHDLADEHYDSEIIKGQSYEEIYNLFDEQTGYHCAKWLIDFCIDNNLELPKKIMIHSMNPAGSRNIKSLFDTYNKVKDIKSSSDIYHLTVKRI